MVVKVSIDGDAVRGAIADLKAIDPKLVKDLRTNIRGAFSGVAAGVKNAFPNEAPLSGMKHFGRTAYAPPDTSVSFTPGATRRGRASSLMSIRVKIPKNAVGSWIAEMAGMRGVVRDSGRSRSFTRLGETISYQMNGQGAYFIDRLNRRSPLVGKGGRYGWKYFKAHLPGLREQGMKILYEAVADLDKQK
jgi:hypothetical protein